MLQRPRPRYLCRKDHPPIFRHVPLTKRNQEAQLRQAHQDEVHKLKTEAQVEREGMLLEHQRKDSKILELEEKVRIAAIIDGDGNELTGLD